MPANCVVCACPAEVYCHHDRAYLCSACDAHVHNAHVLARSHHRVPVSCAPAPEDVASEAMDNVVQQDFLPFGEKLEKDSLACVDNLSFSDDAWFAVPDTVCSNADSHTGGKGAKAKDFGYDDLFELDAALDDDIVGLELDRVSSDLLADCLVPDADVTPAEVSLLCQEESTPSLSAVPDVHNRRVAEEPVTAAPPAQAPLTTFPHPSSTLAAAPAVPPYTFSAQPPVADLVPNFDTYIPASLLPVDPVMRSHALSDRRDKVQRFREKKKNRQFKKLIRYASRKRYAEVRPRIKGRFARKDEIAAAKAAGVPLTC